MSPPSYAPPRRERPARLATAPPPEALTGAVVLGCSLARTRGAEVDYGTPQPSQLHHRRARSDARRV